MTFLSSRFLIVVENRVLVNQKTFLVEKRKSAPLTITGIVSNANANRDTQGAHAVSSFCVVITYHKTRSGVFKSYYYNIQQTILLVQGIPDLFSCVVKLL